MTVNGSTPEDRGPVLPPGVEGLAPLAAAPLPPSGVPGSAPVRGAFAALMVLLSINLFNYIDRQVLAANLSPIEKQLLPAGGADNKERLGNLAMAFMLSYMVFAPLFGWLSE